jgi:ABC-type Fe3+-hydroxamate transport system substrate-binding protein
MSGPERIVCLTEETTEWLYLLGEERRIVGISGYTVRPRRAREEKPRISSFLDGRIDKIVALEPDLVIGFSDMQAALADKLIRAGLNVLITNQRSVQRCWPRCAWSLVLSARTNGRKLGSPNARRAGPRSPAWHAPGRGTRGSTSRSGTNR